MMDPRTKLCWSLAGMFSLFLIDHCLGQMFGLVLILLLIRIKGLYLGRVFFSVRYLLIFLPLTFLVHLLFISRGWQLFSGAMPFTVSILDQPIRFTLRMANLILLMAFVLQWIPDIEFLDGIYHLLRPLRRLGWWIDDFFQIIFIAVKFFPILRDEYRRLDEGWKLLSDRRDRRLAERVQRARKSLIPLMIFSFQRAETLADAIGVRGYATAEWRSVYQPLKFRPGDWFSCGLAMGLPILISVWG